MYHRLTALHCFRFVTLLVPDLEGSVLIVHIGPFAIENRVRHKYGPDESLVDKISESFIVKIVYR